MKLCSTCKVNPRVVCANKSRSCYCKQCWTDRSRKWNKENKDRYRKNQIWSKFGMTPEQHEALLTAQSGVCAICREACALGRELAIDHNHETTKNRGLLCFHCNTGIAHLRESPALLQRSIDYLNSYAAKHRAEEATC